MEARKLDFEFNEILKKHQECKISDSSISSFALNVENLYDFSECGGLEHLGYVVVIRHKGDLFYISMQANLEGFIKFVDFDIKNNLINFVDVFD